MSGDGDARGLRHCTIFGSEAGNHGTETGQRYRAGGRFEFLTSITVMAAVRVQSHWIATFRGGERARNGVIIATVLRFLRGILLNSGSGFRATPWGKTTGHMCGT